MRGSDGAPRRRRAIELEHVQNLFDIDLNGEHRLMKIRKIAWLLALGALSGQAFAQGTITDGTGNYVIPASHFDATPAANFTGVGAGDQIFEAGWWFRIEGDTAETFFPAPDTQNYTGNTATITWANVGGRGFSATKTHVISASGGNGEVATTMLVTNTGATPITLHLFQATDWDVNGTAAGDSGILVDPVYIRITDATAGQAEMRGPNAVAAIARPFSASADVPGLLSDAVVTNFDGSGFPFGPGDITSGLQWTFALAPGASATAQLFNAANRTATPVQLQSFGID